MNGGQNIAYVIWGGLLIIGLLSWFIWDKRYRQNVGKDLPQGYKKTDEVFIDPVDGRRQRVYYNPDTGDRQYIEEK